MLITSLDNTKIKNLLKLKQKKYRDLSNEYLIEGQHLVQEAYQNNVIKELILLDGTNSNIEIKTTYVTAEIMKKLTELDTPTNIMALCEKKESLTITGTKILLLDKIQDPGNLGTIIRSAKAFNVDTLILSPDTVDLYNSKVLRSTQGIYNYLNIIKMDLLEAIKIIKEKNITLYGTNVVKGINIKSLQSKDKKSYALIMGNEGQGLTKSLQDLCDENIYIPMNEDVESLNVAVATSILLYELNGE